MLFHSDDKILVVGGMKPDSTPCEKCRVLDAEKNIWLSLPDLPTPRYAAGTFLRGDKLYLVGGCLISSLFKQTAELYLF